MFFKNCSFIFIYALLTVPHVGFCTLIDKKDCQEYSFYPHYSNSAQTQLRAGFCSAFAVADLLSEFLCISDPNSCGAQLSKIDLSRCSLKDKNLLEDYGFDPAALIECAHSEGVCEERFAPFPKPNSFIRKMANLGVQENPFIFLYKKLSKSSERKARRALHSWGLKEPDDLSSSLSSFQSGATSYTEFLKSILISTDCENHRKTTSAHAVRIDKKIVL